MPTYLEICPLHRTSKTIQFEVDGERIPSPTRPCFCHTEPVFTQRGVEEALVKIAATIGTFQEALVHFQQAIALPHPTQPHSSKIIQLEE